MVMEVLPTFPAKTVPEFIAYAKANPGKINMASGGIGGPQHIAGELFKYMAGVNLVHVPYHGSTPALIDLLAGQVQVMFDVTPTSLPHIRAGKLKPLGGDHAGAARLPARRAGDGGVSARLRGVRLDRLRRARRARRPRSSNSSTAASMPRSPIRRSRAAWRISAASSCRRIRRRIRQIHRHATPRSGSRS